MSKAEKLMIAIDELNQITDNITLKITLEGKIEDYVVTAISISRYIISRTLNDLDKFKKSVKIIIHINKELFLSKDQLNILNNYGIVIKVDVTTSDKQNIDILFKPPFVEEAISATERYIKTLPIKAYSNRIS